MGWGHQVCFAPGQNTLGMEEVPGGVSLLQDYPHWEFLCSQEGHLLPFMLRVRQTWSLPPLLLHPRGANRAGTGSIRCVLRAQVLKAQGQVCVEGEVNV